ncbi:LAME_0G19922g1_1 [Lachancea meyersii CBS 8951]|uniref:LAME_0G19922g1_1 n=1 Tax=Lachancea meyersii CBS 8951 TaxID=1266667 RepID=A0A1G4KCB6_9SACH|nr:LAME_0G19922g1_1 [Lachancea meyersii CBS 8951]
MVRKSKTKPSKKRVQNALEIAQRELNGSSDEESGFSRDLRRNGTVINPHRRSSDAGDDSTEDKFEDEEIDSDEALGSEDEFDVMNSKFSQTIRDRKKTAKNGDLPSDDEEDEEGGYTSIDEDDLMPLSAVWDLDDKTNSVQDSLNLVDDDQEEEEEDEEEEDSSEDEDDSEDDEEDENKSEDPFDEISEGEDNVELNTITANLRKDTEKNQYRRLNNAAIGEENEFALPSFANDRKKLNLADMVNAIDDKEAIEKAGLVKGKTQALNVPLPQRIQQRHDRKAAYEISKDEVNKWRDVVQQNRQAEHLSFPLNPQTQHNDGTMFTPSERAVGTELEQKVDSLLETSKLADPVKESTFEEIATAKMSPEEMKKRTAEVRLMRELMFREERKAKRIKKIKSKAYRRIKKKELLKNKELIEESEEESDNDRDAARARERMSLKHKTTSKWAKDMVKHGMTKDKQTREEMEEMLRQGERLRSKIAGHESGSESDSGLSDIENSENSRNASEESKLRDNLGKTGVMNMAFMKNAEARRAEANKESIAQLRDLESGNDGTSLDNEEVRGANVTINAGRRIYAPGTEDSKLEADEAEKAAEQDLKDDDSRSLVNQMTKKSNKKNGAKSGKSPKTKTNKYEENEELNPWLVGSGDESSTKKSNKINVIDEHSSKLAKSANKIAKNQAKRSAQASKKGSGTEEQLLDVDSTNKMDLVDPYSQQEEDIDGFMFKQQEVIAEAFAGDDVEDKFQQEKKRVAIDEDDKVEDVTLPGWGDWAGAGAAPTKKRKFKTTKGTVEKDKRKDKNLKNVIINEKVNKKNLKYQSSAVPFPFESREQYERSLRMPLGQEWTSRTSHQRMIKPRIMTKRGTVIDPLKAPFK